MARTALQGTATVEVKSERTVKLTPKQTTKLRSALKGYATLKGQRDALDHAMKKHRGDAEDVLEELGESSVAIDGMKATIVAPVRKSTDLVELKKALLAKNVDLDIIDFAISRAVKEVPQTPYVKVSLPGKDDDDE